MRRAFAGVLALAAAVALTVVLGSGCSVSGLPGGGEATAADVFEQIDEEALTFKDIAPVQIPAFFTATAGENVEKAAGILESFNDLIASGDGMAAPRSLSAGVAARGGVPGDCTTAGPMTTCIYQWQDADLHCTLVQINLIDSHMQLLYHYKGEDGGVVFPGDLEDPDDWGFLMQTHWYAADATSAMIDTMMSPEYGECAGLPLFRWSFEVEGEDVTIATPWEETTLARYEYGSEIYICDPVDDYHLSLGSYMEREPNDDLAMCTYSWGLKYHTAYKSWDCFYDASEETMSWALYDEDGKVLEEGELGA